VTPSFLPDLTIAKIMVATEEAVHSVQKEVVTSREFKITELFKEMLDSLLVMEKLVPWRQ
jgi:hypothetical protein